MRELDVGRHGRCGIRAKTSGGFDVDNDSMECLPLTFVVHYYICQSEGKLLQGDMTAVGFVIGEFDSFDGHDSYR